MLKITLKEKEVLKLIRYSFKNIAKRLLIEPTTVKTHFASMYNKVGASNKIELLLVALNKKIINIDEIE